MADHIDPEEASGADPVPSQWERFIPWYLTAISCLLLFGLGWFIVDNVFWMRAHMFGNVQGEDLSYRSHQYFLLISTVRRSAGLFAGIALMLLGVGIVFYVARTQSKIDMNLHGVSIGIITASPGIIAMALGSFLIAHNTASKDLVPIFGSSGTTQEDLLNATESATQALDALNR